MRSKRNKGKQKPNIPPAPKPTPAPPPTAESPAQTLAKLEDAAMVHATESDLQTMEPTPPQQPNASHEELVRRASELLALLEAQRKRLEQDRADIDRREAAAEEQKGKLKQERSELETQRTELTTRDKEVSEQEKKLEANESDLLKRLEVIVQREMDADASFSRRNREALAQLEAEGEVLRTQFSRHREKMDEERAVFESALQEKRDRLAADAETQRAKDAAELISQREELDKERESLATEAQRLRKQFRDLDLDRELLDEDRASFDDKVTRRAAREVELKDGELRALAERLEAARAERDRFAQRLAEREEADRRFGGDTPDQVLKRMRGLELECERLRKALGERPSAEATHRLQELERQRELWESDQLRLLSELGEARQDAARKRIAVAEIESLRDEKRAFESANALLHEANRQLRTEVDSLVKGVEGKSPFPSCSEMDSNNELQSTRPTTEAIRNLADFAEFVQHRMAWDPKTKRELYYSAEDVRSFLV